MRNMKITIFLRKNKLLKVMNFKVLKIKINIK